MSSTEDKITRIQQSIAELEAKFTSEQLQDAKALFSLRQMLEYLEEQTQHGI